ncbi:MAG: 5-formyltetrahydrofolate cyclo-ligase [Firmicutes bacterium]|nr:5-formyltetrahydrofolate cyclo-ligase [Bacillota bacterium]
METKKVLRKEVLAQRDALAWPQIESFSQSIAARLFTLPEYQSAGTVMYYLNFGKEVMTLKMVPQSLAHGKRVVAPKTVPKEKQMIISQILDVEADLAPGLWDIPEPKAEALRPIKATEIDLVVVPGVAFDVEGRRLGYGGGYYDRFFPQLRQDVPLVAVTFELQILQPKIIPLDSWDRQVDIIITEERVLDCRNQ